MSQYDAPDWQHIITIQSPGGPVDSPDWQTVVTGPGGAAPTAGGASDGWAPSQFGAVAWTFPPYMIFSDATAVQTSHIVLAQLPVGVTGTVSNLAIEIGSAGTGLTANENYMGIYQMPTGGGPGTAMTLIASSAAGVCDTLFNHVGNKTISMSASVTLTAGGIYYAALLCNYTGNNLKLYQSTLDSGIFGNGPPIPVPGGHGIGSVAFIDQAAHTTLPTPFTVGSSTTQWLMYCWAF